jgi:hypothetical protein
MDTKKGDCMNRGTGLVSLNVDFATSGKLTDAEIAQIAPLLNDVLLKIDAVAKRAENRIQSQQGAVTGLPAEKGLGD